MDSATFTFNTNVLHFYTKPIHIHSSLAQDTVQAHSECLQDLKGSEGKFSFRNKQLQSMYVGVCIIYTYYLYVLLYIYGIRKYIYMYVDKKTHIRM